MNRKVSFALIFGLILMTTPGDAAEEAAMTQGQTVYVPIYSHVLHGNHGRSGNPDSALFSAMLSIRNTDADDPITVLLARYYDTSGKHLRDYYETPMTLPPMASTELFIEHRDAAGGTGANFLVTWDAKKPVNPPIIEAVHANLFGSTGAIFIVRGQPVNVHKR
ncbi:MAG: DUF3124 domain-containing protein [Alphaproteobacteria bacterium]